MTAEKTAVARFSFPADGGIPLGKEHSSTSGIYNVNGTRSWNMSTNKLYGWMLQTVYDMVKTILNDFVFTYRFQPISD